VHAGTTIAGGASPRRDIVETKVTCPFLGPAVADGVLPVLGEGDSLLAAIAEVKRLGNTGGGDLGRLLAFFAQGNHAFMRGPNGRLDQEVPPGLFSLELPGSQGSHPGHSGILQGDPNTPGSGRLDRAAYARLVSRAENGLVRRADVARFIAENLVRDPESKVVGSRVAALLARDVADLAGTAGSAVLTRVAASPRASGSARRRLAQRLTKLLGANNLLGSAGEFGLLFAFVANRPGARTRRGDPTVSVDDLRAMFLDKRLPEGWDTWKKTRRDWVVNASALAVHAAIAYAAMRRGRR
jgi:hypothetical protein